MTIVDVILGEGAAAEQIHGICLKTGPPQQVGVELEWLIRDARDPGMPVPAARIAAAVSGLRAETFGAQAFGAQAFGAQTMEANGRDRGEAARVWRLPSSASPGILPSGAFLTAEPGGQLEISSLPAGSLAECVAATAADLTALRAAVADAGLELAGFGLDPHRPPRRILDLPRYAAMETFFDRGGPWGRQMMCGTASVQVSLDAGDESGGVTGYRHRWRLLHAMGPVLVAAFANSPLRGGRPTGWRSARQQIWANMDPGRTRPPRLSGGIARPFNGQRNGNGHGHGSGFRHGTGDGDLRAAWTEYALDAQVMCVRDPDSTDWTAPPGLTFRDWVRGGAIDGERLRRPTADDLSYHLSTLFPPVRPRGHFEVRMIDAQPGDGWVVPLALTTALLDDARAADAATAAVERLWAGHGQPGEWPPGQLDGNGTGAATGTGGENPWPRAARLGPADPAIARASRECFTAARSALDRMAVPAAITKAVDDFIERYVSKDRCPADDLLEESQ